MNKGEINTYFKNKSVQVSRQQAGKRDRQGHREVPAASLFFFNIKATMLIT